MGGHCVGGRWPRALAFVTLWGVGAGLFAADLSSTTGPRPARVLWAVVAGVSDYENLPAAGAPDSLSDLRHAADDARAVAEFLDGQRGRYYENVLTEKLLEESATAAGFQRTIRETLDKAADEDTVLIYFSGHGLRQEEGLSLLFWDYDPRGGGSYRGNDLWDDVFAHPRRADVVFVIDACHAGALGSGRWPFASEAAVAFGERWSSDRRVGLLAASRAADVAQEDVASGGSLTRLLLEVLSNGAKLTLGEAATLVRKQLDQRGSRQVPVANGDVSVVLAGPAESTFNASSSPRPLLAIRAQPKAWLLITRIDDGRVIDPGIAAEELKRRLNPGRYLISARAEGYQDAVEEVTLEGDTLVRIELKPSPRRAVILDFEEAQTDAMDRYFARKGIRLSGITAGTRLQVFSDEEPYGGWSFEAASGARALSQGGHNDPLAFTLEFVEPWETVRFTRVKLLSGPSGITHPRWSACALDDQGREVDCAREGLIRAFENVPSQVFVLRARAIRAVRFSSDSQHFAAFSALVLDDLELARSLEQ